MFFNTKKYHAKTQEEAPKEEAPVKTKRKRKVVKKKNADSS